MYFLSMIMLLMLARALDLAKLLEKKSHFLLGPRGTGKSSLIRNTLQSATYIDLLSEDTFDRLLRRPSALAEYVPPHAREIVIDEIQRIPALLNEVHRLIEARKMRFLLTGSSARKLRRGTANLLGGRAWEARLFPLTAHELGDAFDLEKYLNRGGLPAIYFSDFPADELLHYGRLYLREEVQAEALVRRLDLFARFLDVAAIMNGEEINYQAVASDAGVPAKTVGNFFDVLEDTLLGFRLQPYGRSTKRKAIQRAKFYFFDVGVAGSLAKRGQVQAGSNEFGRALEHFIVQEVRAYASYMNIDAPLGYWRTTSQDEVDLTVGEQLAVEVKSTEHASERHLKGLRALAEEGKFRKLVLVSRDPIPRHASGIEAMPWKAFLDQLWAGELI
jgi:predicted AAA+ superfamily ATPase